MRVGRLSGLWVEFFRFCWPEEGVSRILWAGKGFWSWIWISILPEVSRGLFLAGVGGGWGRNGMRACGAPIHA